MRGRSGLCLCLMLLAWQPALSAPNPVAESVDSAVTAWMKDHHIADAEVAVALHQDLVGSYDHGWKPTERHPIASLSKAITGVCIAGLVDDKRLAFDGYVGQRACRLFQARQRRQCPQGSAFQQISPSTNC